jgi:hypothetical protein
MLKIRAAALFLALSVVFTFALIPNNVSAATPDDVSYGEKVAKGALQYVGKQVKDFNSVEFVSYVFDYKGFGYYVPSKHSQIGKAGHEISLKDLEPGDIVYISKRKSKVWAAGIYVGNNEVVMANYHFDHKVHKITIDELNKKFKVFARRVADDVCTSCGPEE